MEELQLSEWIDEIDEVLAADLYRDIEHCGGGGTLCGGFQLPISYYFPSGYTVARGKGEFNLPSRENYSFLRTRLVSIRGELVTGHL